MSLEELGSASPIDRPIASLVVKRLHGVSDPVAEIRETTEAGKFIALNADPDSMHYGEQIVTVGVEQAEEQAVIGIRAAGERAKQDPSLVSGVVQAAMQHCGVEVGYIPEYITDIPQETLAQAFAPTPDGHGFEARFAA